MQKKLEIALILAENVAFKQVGNFNKVLSASRLCGPLRGCVVRFAVVFFAEN
jgi:hypothetical protein